MSNEFKISLITSISWAIVGALVTGLFSLLIFFLGNFSTQSTIEKNTVKTLSGYFDSVDKDMSYEQALKTIYEESENQKNEIDNLKNQLEEKEKLIDHQNSEEEINEIIQDATTYWNNSDFIQALTILNKSKSISKDIEVLYEQYSNQFCSHIISQADALVLEGNYDEAITNISDVLSIVSNNSKLKHKIEEIQNLKPQNLMDIITPYEKKGYTEKTKGEYMLMGGEKYYNGFQLGDSFTNTYAIFNLNARYSKIKGIIGHIDDSGDADKIVDIFADNILIDTIEIKYQDLPKDFDIDVTGINQLKFERSDGSTQTGFGDIFIQ